MKTFGFIGLGLMGGSYAKAIRNCAIAASPFIDGGLNLFACDKDIKTLQIAKNDGIIDKDFLVENVDEMLSSCDVVFICLYPKQALNFLIEHQNSFKPGAIVTDIAGTKISLVEGLKNFNRTDVDFIPAHPMAGSEKEGYLHSSADIFKGRNYIIVTTDTSKTENISFLKNLAYAIGFKKVIETTARSHDHKIAFTSQLCHIIASALVDSAEDTEITAFGGGSYEDLTRIAMINAPLWTELFIENKEELLEHIEKFESSLEVLKQLVISSNSNTMKEALQKIREKRIEMSTK